ncbi:MAG: YdbL family protein [Victivallaceae bacterium]|jgi:hypothetical protein
MRTNSIISTAAKVLFVMAMLTAVFNLNAGTKDEIIARMKERLPAIERLKDAGVVGENNLGFLQVRDDSADTRNAVDTENNDRKQVYAAIAAKNGTTVEVVGKRRAIKLAEKAKKDQWLQNDQGEWYQKK